MYGFATPEGTARFQNRFASPYPFVWRSLGKTGLCVGAFGFGGYRIHNRQESYQDALLKAVAGGCNLIDTSSNYGDGGSEILVGSVIQRLSHEYSIGRDEIVVVTKGGYIQGSNLAIAKQREIDGNPFPDVVRYMEGCWHCIHPEFLEDQLDRSLKRLGLQTIDVYLLHNPEYFLTDYAKKKRGPIEAAREEYNRRIALAFQWMERKVQEGRIRYYGISSNTFPDNTKKADFTSFEQTLEIAEAISPNHHYAVIQLPMNLLERGAWVHKTQANGTKSVLQAAKQANIAVLINRPLNAFAHSRIIRLSEFGVADEDQLHRQMETVFAAIGELENHYQQDIGSMPEFRELTSKYDNHLMWGDTLSANYAYFRGFEEWNSTLESMIWPAFLNAVSLFSSCAEGNESWHKWVGNYTQRMVELVALISAYYENKAQARSARIRERISHLNTNLAFLKTLSQKSVHLLASIPEITTVLIGMRRPEYVDDILRLRSHPPIIDAHDVLETLDRSQILEEALS